MRAVIRAGSGGTEHMWNHPSKLAGWRPGQWNLQHLPALQGNEMMGLCK